MTDQEYVDVELIYELYRRTLFPLPPYQFSIEAYGSGCIDGMIKRQQGVK